MNDEKILSRLKRSSPRKMTVYLSMWFYAYKKIFIHLLKNFRGYSSIINNAPDARRSRIDFIKSETDYRRHLMILAVLIVALCALFCFFHQALIKKHRRELEALRTQLMKSELTNLELAKYIMDAEAASKSTIG